MLKIYLCRYVSRKTIPKNHHLASTITMNLCQKLPCFVRIHTSDCAMGGLITFCDFFIVSFGIWLCRAHLQRFLWLASIFRSGTICSSGEAEAGTTEEHLSGITGVVKPNASPQCSCRALRFFRKNNGFSTYA